MAHASGRTILEVAAGTGYWTAVAAPVAKAITATDINAETLAIAAARKLGEHVALVQADAGACRTLPERFDVGMAHLWWSHVRKQDRGQLSVPLRFASSGARHAADDRPEPRPGLRHADQPTRY